VRPAVATNQTWSGDLRFNLCWDDLRGDTRFDKIVAAEGRQQISSLGEPCALSNSAHAKLGELFL